MGGCCGNVRRCLQSKRQTLLWLHISRKRQLGLRDHYRSWRGEFAGNGSQNLHHFQNAAMSRMGGPPCFLAMINGYFYLKWGTKIISFLRLDNPLNAQWSRVNNHRYFRVDISKEKP